VPQTPGTGPRSLDMQLGVGATANAANACNAGHDQHADTHHERRKPIANQEHQGEQRPEQATGPAFGVGAVGQDHARGDQQQNPGQPVEIFDRDNHRASS